jgi:hypothetical protein
MDGVFIVRGGKTEISDLRHSETGSGVQTTSGTRNLLASSAEATVRHAQAGASSSKVSIDGIALLVEPWVAARCNARRCQ